MSKREFDIPPWEWAIAALGASIVLGAIVFFGLQIAHPSGSPHFTIRTDSVFAHDSHHVMMIEVKNHGRTASNVVIEGTLNGRDGQPERSEATLSFLPANSQQTVGLLFSSDPRAHPVRVTVRSFAEP